MAKVGPLPPFAPLPVVRRKLKQVIEALDHNLSALDNLRPEGTALDVLTSNGTSIPSYQPAQGVTINFGDIGGSVDPDQLPDDIAYVNVSNAFERINTFESVQRFLDGIEVDTISEYTADAGVTIDGVLLKDDLIILPDTTEPATVDVNTLAMFVEDNDGLSHLHIKNEFGLKTQLARDNIRRVRNTSGSDMVKGQVVAVTGATSDVPNVELSDASDPTLEAHGVLAEDIVKNELGHVMLHGTIRGIKTNYGGWNEGDQIFVSTTPGELTNVPPSHPNLRQVVGEVIRTHPNDGILDVDMAVALGNFFGTRQNEFKIGDGTDGDKLLTFAGVTDHTLTVDTATGIWSIPDILAVDVIQEATPAAGVTIDGVLLKDGGGKFTGVLNVDLNVDHDWVAAGWGIAYSLIHAGGGAGSAAQSIGFSSQLEHNLHGSTHTGEVSSFHAFIDVTGTGASPTLANTWGFVSDFAFRDTLTYTKTGAFHATWRGLGGEVPIITNLYGLLIDATPTTTVVNGYGVYIGNIIGSSLAYAIYTNAGLVRFGDILQVNVINEVTGAAGVTIDGVKLKDTYLGLGGATPGASQSALNIVRTGDFSSDAYGILLLAGYAGAGGAVETYGIFSQISNAVSSGAHTGSQSAFRAFVDVSGSGSSNVVSAFSASIAQRTHAITNLFGLRVLYQLSGTPAVTNSYGIYLDDVLGTPTNAYGIYLEDVIGATLSYAIYTKAGLVRFGDIVNTIQYYQVSGTKVVGAQGAAVSDATGGTVQDTEARTAINTLLARLRTHGLIAT